MKARMPLLVIAVLAAAAPAPAQQASLIASFIHQQSSVPYKTKLFGRVSLVTSQSANGESLRFRLPLGESACALTITIAPQASQTVKNYFSTGPFRVCLTQTAVTDKAFNQWLSNRKNGVDPTLTIGLAPDANAPQSWVNAGPLAARLFVRECDASGKYRHLADLVAPAGSIAVKRSSSQSGADDISLSVNQAVLEPGAQDTWKSVIRSCGNAQVPLPEAPAIGIASMLAASTAWVVPTNDSVRGGFDALRADLEAMTDRGGLDTVDAIGLVQLIDDASADRRAGDPTAATREVDRLEERVGLLEASGAMSAADAAAVRARAGLIEALLIDSILGAVDVSRDLSCALKEPCTRVSFHVNARTRVSPAEQDGTAARPFASIAAALDRAATTGACGVSLRVAAGRYAENISIARDTAIAGAGVDTMIAGVIDSSGAFDLSLDNLVVTNPDGPGVRATNACARTSLRNVTVDMALHHGIDIAAGAFVANSLRVVSTIGNTAAVSSGVGIRIRDGARAAISRVELTDNGGQALMVAGAGTRTFARNVTTARNHYLPFFSSLQAAVSALEGGLLLMESSTIDHSEGIGLQASDDSAVHFRAGRISDTAAVARSDTLTGWGTGAAAHNNSILELSTFTIERSEFLGLQYAVASFGTATDGVVRSGAVGANIQTEDFDLACISRTVAYFDNGVNLDAASLPVPGNGPPREDTPVCRTVPFECTWCAP